MELTTKQKEGLKIAIDRHKAGEKYTVIAGYAGTGKSTLVKFITDALRAEKKRVCYAAFTGKAAEVLRKKGNQEVYTLHKLLYEHIPLPGGGFYRRAKPRLDYDIVVVDEVSMAPLELMTTLFKHPVYVICLGDPFQLPPVEKKQDNHLLDHPHIFLDEIMRQEEGSEIIQLTMKIRNGEEIKYFNGETVKVIPKTELNTGLLTWGDQVLVATNAVRHNINNQMRALYNHEGEPQDGDKVICIRNYWEDINEKGDALVNGTLGYIHNPYMAYNKIPAFAGNNTIEILDAEFVDDEGISYKNLQIDKKLLTTGEYSLDWRQKYKLGKNPRTKHLVPKEFVYGYAITCHKSQGSEWDNVVVLEEEFPFDKEEHARWLYTATTRAAKKLVLVR